MKSLKSYVGHPALKYNEQKIIIITKGKYYNPQMYLITKSDVVEITPIEVQYTNIGEPYRELARFIFSIDGEEETDYIDINPNDLQLLVDMFKELVWASEIDIPERLSRYLDSYEDD